MVEINDLRRRIARLKFEHADQIVIDELEAQLRILRAIYDSANSLFVEGERNGRLQAAFQVQGRGNWIFDDVYAYVYDEAVAIEPDGQDLATLIWHHDYASPLLAAVHAK